MAVSIDWGTKVISLLQSDLTSLGGGVYELDVNWFRLQLKDLEDDVEGIVFPRTHNHNTETVLGGVTYARFIEIINGYTVTFEDGQYAVKLTGGNNNIEDVMNVNQVSLRSSNTAGMVSLQGVLDILEADVEHHESTNTVRLRHKTTGAILLEKDVTVTITGSGAAAKADIDMTEAA